MDMQIFKFINMLKVRLKCLLPYDVIYFNMVCLRVQVTNSQETFCTLLYVAIGREVSGPLRSDVRQKHYDRSTIECSIQCGYFI